MMKILVTGATGYIGGRLVPRLLKRGYKVAVLVRDRSRIIGRSWEQDVEIHQGDISDSLSLAAALSNVDVVYYLVHSMYTNVNYVHQDRRAVSKFVQHARHVKHVIYLGGLLPPNRTVSHHLQSRAEVGEILRLSVPTTEFRAGPIIGSGSASFEMVRYLTQRFPVVMAPTWIKNKIQPIAVRDILSYLILAIERGPQGVIEVGTDQQTFQSMMEIYAEDRGLKRWFFHFPPFLKPKIVGYLVGLVTPITSGLAIPLVEGMANSIVGETQKAREIFPEVDPLTYRQAVKLALARIEQQEVTTRWSTALHNNPTYELTDRQGLNREIRSIYSEYPVAAVFKSFSSIGGQRGWLVWRWAWEIRGLMDKILGGPGLRRGRRDPDELLPGEALDFWRVERIEPHHLLLLRAEMKLPGKAWLQWEAIAEGEGTRLIQTAIFEPRGLKGVLYWYSLYPFHQFIFGDMIRAIAKDARLFCDKDTNR